jgi:chlorite dismutase
MPNRYVFTGGKAGKWRVRSMRTIRGAALAEASRVDIAPAHEADPSAEAYWRLHGLISNIRYATRAEVTELQSRQETLNRPFATHAALIPIAKSAAWWTLAQDERRAIFEAQSRHTAIGLRYLPAIARQLYHCRDLEEPFDFLTWFEYAPAQADAFEELVGQLRATAEWTYVEREIDIRLERD